VVPAQNLIEFHDRLRIYSLECSREFVFLQTQSACF
jgi:hypothetical protein